MYLRKHINGNLSIELFLHKHTSTGTNSKTTIEIILFHFELQKI